MTINSLQAQSAIWIFTLSLGSIFLFSIISFFVLLLETGVQQFSVRDLPPIIIVFSIISVLVSNKISSVVSKPFIEIRKIIEMFNRGDHENTKIKIQTNIEELKELELFLLNSLRLKSEKFHMEEKFAKEARQVAHDIRSPLSALDVISRDISINNKKQKMLLDSISHVKEISNTLLNKYTQRKKNTDKISVFDLTKLFHLILEVVKERQITINKNKVSISINVAGKDKSVYVNANPILFKRVISNIINNSIESIKDTGKIDINIKSIVNSIRVEIKDNGCGMPADILTNIFKEGFTYGKERGTGLGLDFVASCIESWNGDYNIQSKEFEGTTFGFVLPAVNLLKSIVLLDDSMLVTMSWELEAEKYGYDIKTFNEIYDFMKYIKKCNKDVMIYVDSNLNTNISGEMLLKELYELGFKNLFLETGNDLNDYKNLTWIKGVIGKNPPFSDPVSNSNSVSSLDIGHS